MNFTETEVLQGNIESKLRGMFQDVLRVRASCPNANVGNTAQVRAWMWIQKLAWSLNTGLSKFEDLQDSIHYLAIPQSRRDKYNTLVTKLQAGIDWIDANTPLTVTVSMNASENFMVPVVSDLDSVQAFANVVDNQIGTEIT